MKYGNLIVVDCEASGVSPVNGTMTEFGAVHFASRATFHGRLFEGTPDPENPAKPIPGKRVNSDRLIAGRFASWLEEFPGRKILVSDNPAYDFMWIAGMFDSAGLENPFGHSGRRISDFWAGLQRDWGNTQRWKGFRMTPHDHNPVNDAMGNAEALARIFREMDDARPV